nr:hypothetical protein [Tanacetum cinerariifolium]
LNSAAGGNFLDKMPADCLKIIESKSKVRQTRAKAVVAKDMVRALLLDKKNQYSTQTSSPTPAPIKAIEPSCVTCGANHAYQNCPATSGNVYQDNIQDVPTVLVVGGDVMIVVVVESSSIVKLSFVIT